MSKVCSKSVLKVQQFYIDVESSCVLHVCFVLFVLCLFVSLLTLCSMFSLIAGFKNRYSKSIQHRPQASRQCFANSLRVPAENSFYLYHAWKFYAYFVETRWTTLLSPNAYEHPHEINKQPIYFSGQTSRNHTSHSPNFGNSFFVILRNIWHFTDFFVLVCPVSFLASTTNNIYQIN